MRLALFAVLLVVGCKKSEPPVPTCEQVTDHLLDAMKIAYPGHADMGVMADRKQMIAQCEARSLSPEERRCLMAARELEAAGRCYKARGTPRP